jgi:acetyltransferase-like isoleucine patch superfamily enzyme
MQIWIAKKERGFPYSISLRKIYSELYGIQIGYGSYGGCFNTRNIPKGVSFGNYCSIAKNVKIFRANHPANTFTSHPILYNPEMGFVKKDKLNRPPLIVGNDVWIGANVVILPNVKVIGNGAIIGAGSIVSKDVEPYTVMAGNPAKFLKKRFSDSVIEKLEKSRWWDLEFDDLIKRIDEFNRMIDESN